MSILIIAEHDNSSLKPATLNSVTAAQEIGGDIDILVAGSDCQAAAEQAAAKKKANAAAVCKGAGPGPRGGRLAAPPDLDREARQVANATKQLAYYTKENEMLKKKVARARSADEHLSKLEEQVGKKEVHVHITFMDLGDS